MHATDRQPLLSIEIASGVRKEIRAGNCDVDIRLTLHTGVGIYGGDCGSGIGATGLNRETVRQRGDSAHPYWSP